MNQAFSSWIRSYLIWMICSVILFLLLLLLLFNGALSGGSKPSHQETLAIVNGHVIDKESLYELLVDSGGKKALEQLIVNELIHQEADKQHVAVTEADIDQELNIIKLAFQSPEDYLNQLSEDGFTERSVRSQIRTQLLLRGLLGSDIDISDADVRRYYDQNVALWTGPEAVRVSHILVATKAEAEALREEINGGGNFAELAKQYSLDPGVDSNSGDLGFIQRGFMEPSFEDAAFSEEIGQAAAIVETSQGYHILQVTDRKSDSKASYEERKDELRNELIDSQIYELIDPWLQQLRDKASIELIQSAAIFEAEW